MQPRNRVLNAVEHKEIDRFPRDLGGLVSGISKIAYVKLLKILNLPVTDIQISDTIQQLAQIEESILKKFKIDTRHVRAKGQKSKIIDTDTFIDPYGVKYQKIGIMEYPILYYESVSFPLAKASLQDLHNYRWPKPTEEWFSGCEREAKNHKKETEYAIVADPLSGGIQEQATWLRGNEQFLHDLYNNRDFIEELLDLTLVNQQEIVEMYLDNLGEYVDILIYGDDYGNQDRLMMHPNMWRNLIKPRVKILIETIKKINKGVKIQLHSCGMIHTIIPDLIELGFDILNPMQPCMNHSLLKENYGEKICFHGGVDIQYTLPYGTFQEITNEIKRVTNELGSDSTGYIFAMAHNILADVPPENILTAYNSLDR